MGEKMTFIDNLSLELFVLGFLGLYTDYVFLAIWRDIRSISNAKADPNISTIMGSRLNDSMPMFAALGIFFLVMGLWGEFTWTLPGPYNILFDDPYTLLGIILIGFAISIKYERKLQYVGLITLFTGLMTIWYGISGYRLGLTLEPLALLGLYVSYGLAGIFSYPLLLTVDGYKSGKSLNRMFLVWVILFVIFATIGSILAIYIGAESVPEHLAHPP